MVEQVVIVVVVAFALFALYRFRDFVFGRILGGLVALVMRASRLEEVRAAAGRKRHEQIEEDYRTLSDTLLDYAVRHMAREFNYPYTQKLAIVRQMIGRLEHESPTLLPLLSAISQHLDGSTEIDAKTARQLLDPVGREVAALTSQTAKKG